MDARNLYEIVQDNYEEGDFILFNSKGEDVAVSGNSDFWDFPHDMPPVNPNGKYLIIEVIEKMPGMHDIR